MKRILTAAVLLMASVICHAQITPPKQIDTLVVTALKYDHDEVGRKNWPCTIIYKSNTDFRIGGNIVNAKIMDDISSSNQCLRFFALRSASMSSFMPSEQAPPLQTGEIVYRFFRKDPAMTKNIELSNK